MKKSHPRACKPNSKPSSSAKPREEAGNSSRRKTYGPRRGGIAVSPITPVDEQNEENQAPPIVVVPLAQLPPNANITMATANQGHEPSPPALTEGAENAMSSSTERLWADIDEYVDETPMQTNRVTSSTIAPPTNTPPPAAIINDLMPSSTTIANQNAEIGGPPSHRDARDQLPPINNEPRVGDLEEEEANGEAAGDTTASDDEIQVVKVTRKRRLSSIVTPRRITRSAAKKKSSPLTEQKSK